MADVSKVLTPEERNMAAMWEVVRALRLDVTTIAHEDAPDLRITTSTGRVIGVEVTEVADNGVAHADAATQRFDQALTDCLKANSTNASILVGNGEGFAELLAKRSECARHVEALARLAATHIRERRPMRTYQHRELLQAGAPYILRATIFAAEEPAAGSVLHAGGRHASFVQTCIDKKNALAPRYRTETPEGLWLLLLAGIAFRSGVSAGVIRDHEYVSAFDRILCVDAYEGLVFEVPTRAK